MLVVFHDIFIKIISRSNLKIHKNVIPFPPGKWWNDVFEIINLLVGYL